MARPRCVAWPAVIRSTSSRCCASAACGRQQPIRWDDDAHGMRMTSKRRDGRSGSAQISRHKQMLALRIWDEAVDPRGTIAEAYLKGRGLVAPAISEQFRSFVIIRDVRRGATLRLRSLR